MRECDLMALDLKHLFSEVTSSSGSELEGYTEWFGDFEGKPVSLSWTWSILSDNATQMKNPPPLTSNIMLVNELGYDLGPVETTKKCSQKITKIQWTSHIADLKIGNR